MSAKAYIKDGNAVLVDRDDMPSRYRIIDDPKGVTLIMFWAHKAVRKVSA